MRLFGAMRPTNRKFVQSSVSARSSAGRRGARVSRSTSTASGRTPVGEKPSDSSSRRLNSDTPSASSTRPASAADLLPPQRRQAEDAGVVGREEAGRRHVVVDEHPAPRQAAERRGHRRGQREMEDRHVARRRRRALERPHVACERGVDRQRVDVGRVAEAPQERTEAPGAVADGIALVRGGDPLVDDHRLTARRRLRASRGSRSARPAGRGRRPDGWPGWPPAGRTGRSAARSPRRRPAAAGAPRERPGP